ncbi:hypothetical protein LZ554_006513 [Drepanopeziza brunnea f. sp. 'monogermtubi']|uniref:Signal peptidase complex subunit 1 n=1 Tax=Marssonina brunnea f. sp. multigermtubi (strain MB_m1) TaxID=1072389 RepID=K1WXZ9_MARBU|nr:microsomal signal peptidase 12kDa subunit [Drepanopeziza brunnea f. sp. 'multigermtubi' MB_m1]EKD13513.1 microsomal signal peptidase 12kDa subunit [Drepanopeziza brunnea f. sp. 'multigermtubi' MB_m1]KAI9049482.1 hypothetical protein LZ554_006513 [Drepanopeziza brunnea f. sp. 'monogermtubi']
MADQFLENVRELAEGQIVYFQGQRLAEFLTTALLSISGALAFYAGYAKQDIKGALQIGLLGSAVTFLVVVPPWPFFKRHPVKWLPVGGKHAVPQGIVVDGEIVG